MLKKIYKSIFSEKTRISFRENVIKLFSYFYKGKGYYCVCCKNEFTRFLTKGNIPRTQAQCPFCGSLERTRVLKMYLENETTAFNSTQKILHFAPEKSLLKLLSASNPNYIDADINPNYANHVIDITDIPYQNAYFDIIICAHVLGHIPDEQKAISELFRVIKPGGVVLIQTLLNRERDTFEDYAIVSEKDKLKYYGERDLCRLHGKDFSFRLKKAGFEVLEIDYRMNFDTSQRLKYSLGDGNRELIFRCSKS